MAADAGGTWHPLRTILHAYVATDAQAVEHLQHTMATLSRDALLASSHLPKWTARLSSLLQSKEPAARWTGLCLALKTAQLSQAILMECAQAWVTLSLNLLSRNEPTPILKASARLLYYVFSESATLPEFQRQIATPNVPKYANALIQILKHTSSSDIQILYMELLACLIPMFPTLLRAQLTLLSGVTSTLLHQMHERPQSSKVTKAAADLNAVLHFTGGKAGASGIWRKALDDMITMAYDFLFALRTTVARAGAPHGHPDLSSAPSVAEALEKLSSTVIALNSLLSSVTARSVPVPVVSLSNLCIALLNCTHDEPREPTSDTMRQAQELASADSILCLGCDLLSAVTKNLGDAMVPHLGQILFYLCYHLEQPAKSSLRLNFLRAAQGMLACSLLPQDAQILTRLTKSALSSLILVTNVSNQTSQQDRLGLTTQSRKGKKRARAYEGDEVFNVGGETLCATATEGQVLVSATDVLSLILRASALPPAMVSLAARVLLSVHLALGQVIPATLCNDLTVHGKLLQAVQEMCTYIGVGSTGVMSKTTGLIVQTLATSSSNTISDQIDLLLHPKLPPLMRPMPHLEHLSLFPSEESQEEGDSRRELALSMETPFTPPSLDPAAMVHDSQRDGQSRLTVAPPPNSSTTFSTSSFAPTNSYKSSISQPAAQSSALESQMQFSATSQAPQSGSNPLPPPPDPLPTSSIAVSQLTTQTSKEDDNMVVDEPHRASAVSAGLSNVAPPLRTVLPGKPQEDEELPNIDLGSDSEEDEE